MSRHRVLVTDYTWSDTEVEAEVLARVDADLVIAETGSESELVGLARDADAILTCFAHVSAAVIRAGTRLQVIGRYGIGVDNIDVAVATEHGIPVTNVPAYCLDEVAEHTLALILALARGVCRYDGAVRRGDWSLATGGTIRRLRGQTLGIVGFGKIGRTVAQTASGLGLRVVAHDPTLNDDQIAAAGAEPAPLDELVRRADILTVHVPLTDETRGLIGADLLRSMRPTSIVINTARGGIIDQEALARALNEGWIGGAGMDVFEPERLPIDHPLLAAPNLLVTPHVAFYSEESVAELERLAAENVAAVLEGRRPASVVNAEVLKLARWSHLVAA